MQTIDCDYLIIGSGIAGLLSAVHLSQHGEVVLVTKKERAESNTNYAQGGIACVVDSEDSFEDHVRDTLDAGAGLCDEAVVRAIVSGGPERIAELETLGVVFAEEAGEGRRYDLGKEGGHSRRRVLHAGDITGREIESALLRRALAGPRVRILEQCMAIDLVTTGGLGLSEPNRCVGTYVLDRRSGEIMGVRAPCTVLATGGGGKVYL